MFLELQFVVKTFTGKKLKRRSMVCFSKQTNNRIYKTGLTDLKMHESQLTVINVTDAFQSA